MLCESYALKKKKIKMSTATILTGALKVKGGLSLEMIWIKFQVLNIFSKKY